MIFRSLKSIIIKYTRYESSFIYKKRKERRHTKWIQLRAQNLRNNGHYMLQSLVDVAEEFGIPVWLEYGTLLGAYREHSFIKHDYDLDCGMYAADYNIAFEDALLAKGLVKIRSFYLRNIESGEEMLTEVTFDYHNLQLDIFFKFPQNELGVVYEYASYSDEANAKGEFAVITNSLPRFHNYVKLSIDGKLFPAPANTEELLKAYYGESFMTPIQNHEIPYTKPNYNHLSFGEYRGVMKGYWKLDAIV